MKYIEDRSNDEGCPPKTAPEVGLGLASYPHPFGGKYIQTISISIPIREGFSPARHSHPAADQFLDRYLLV